MKTVTRFTSSCRTMRTAILVHIVVQVCLLLACMVKLGNAACPVRHVGASAMRRSLKQAPPPASAVSQPLNDTYLTPPLQYNFYTSCPQLQTVVSDRVAAHTALDAGTPAPLLRLFFHDCFTQGCDASVLLNSTAVNLAEKDDSKDLTLTHFYVIDDIKATLENISGCAGIVSCADILALAAVASVNLTGGPLIDIALGRRDGLDSFQRAAETSMPGFFLQADGLLDSFQNVGLNLVDLVALSGGHTIGVAHCSASMSDRFQGEPPNIIPTPGSFTNLTFAQELLNFCTIGNTLPILNSTLGTNLDTVTPSIFDNGYFQALQLGQGVITSDNALVNSSLTSSLVALYASNETLFFQQFTESFRKMGRIGVLTGTQGQIRQQCWKRNTGNLDVEFDPISPLICASTPCQLATQCNSVTLATPP